jgi:hypothetical protein
MKIIKYFEAFTKIKLEELKKTERTYLEQILHQNVRRTSDFREISNSLKNYDISNFSYNDKPYDFHITPDKNFIDLIASINEYLETKISTDLQFDFSYAPNDLNLIDFKKGIPDLLRGFGFCYKLYLFVIEKVKFVTTNRYSSKDAINVWHNLVLNETLFAFTSNDITGVIIKNQSNDKIKSYLNELKSYNSNVLKFNFDELVFDDELEEKIIEIYGSLDVYKQRN